MKTKFETTLPIISYCRWHCLTKQTLFICDKICSDIPINNGRRWRSSRGRGLWAEEETPLQLVELPSPRREGASHYDQAGGGILWGLCGKQLKLMIKIFTSRWRVQGFPTARLDSRAAINLWQLGLTAPGSGSFYFRSNGDEYVNDDNDDGGEVWYWISEILQMINNPGVKLWSCQCSLNRCPTCIRLNVGTGNTDTKHVFSQNNSQSTKSSRIWSSTF